MIITVQHPVDGSVSLDIWAQDKDLLTLIGSLRFNPLGLREALGDFLQEVVATINHVNLDHAISILDYLTGEVTVVSTWNDLLEQFSSDSFQVNTLLQVFNNLSWSDAITTREIFLKHFAYEDLSVAVPLDTFNIGDALLERVAAAGITMPLGAYRELLEACEDVDMRVIYELYIESAPTVEFLADLYAYDYSMAVVDALGSVLATESKDRRYLTLSKFIRPGWPHSRIRRSYDFNVVDLGLDMGYVTWADPGAGDVLPQPGRVIRISDYLGG